MTITGRSSSITNAFINAIIPVIDPTEAEERKALEILGMDPADIRCAYCGDKATEWDHLNPIINNQKPTGYITEIANLVPSCGKCNQSKGKSNWRIWMTGQARLSPKTRGVKDIEERIRRLEAYEKSWQPHPRQINFAEKAGEERWKRHRQNWHDVLALLRTSQELASEIRAVVSSTTKDL
jgi:hypothetical protein